MLLEVWKVYGFDPAAIARERKHPVAAEHKFLVTRPELKDSELVPRKELEEDLDYLEHVLVKCFSYLELRPVDPALRPAARRPSHTRRP